MMDRKLRQYRFSVALRNSAEVLFYGLPPGVLVAEDVTFERSDAEFDSSDFFRTLASHEKALLESTFETHIEQVEKEDFIEPGTMRPGWIMQPRKFIEQMYAVVIWEFLNRIGFKGFPFGLYCDGFEGDLDQKALRDLLLEMNRDEVKWLEYALADKEYSSNMYSWEYDTIYKAMKSRLAEFP